MRMRIMAKNKIEKPVELPLVDRILAIRDECDRLIDEIAAERKASPDGRTLPLTVLRLGITRGASCQCQAVLRLLAERQRRGDG